MIFADDYICLNLEIQWIEKKFRSGRLVSLWRVIEILFKFSAVTSEWCIEVIQDLISNISCSWFWSYMSGPQQKLHIQETQGNQSLFERLQTYYCLFS